MLSIYIKTKLKGMTFELDFGFSSLLFSFLLKKREEEKAHGLTKIVIKSHAFQPGHISNDVPKTQPLKANLQNIP